MYSQCLKYFWPATYICVILTPSTFLLFLGLCSLLATYINCCSQPPGDSLEQTNFCMAPFHGLEVGRASLVERQPLSLYWFSSQWCPPLRPQTWHHAPLWHQDKPTPKEEETAPISPTTTRTPTCPFWIPTPALLPTLERRSLREKVLPQQQDSRKVAVKAKARAKEFVLRKRRGRIRWLAICRDLSSSTGRLKEFTTACLAAAAVNQNLSIIAKNLTAQDLHPSRAPRLHRRPLHLTLLPPLPLHLLLLQLLTAQIVQDQTAHPRASAGFSTQQRFSTSQVCSPSPSGPRNCWSRTLLQSEKSSSCASTPSCCATSHKPVKAAATTIQASSTNSSRTWMRQAPIPLWTWTTWRRRAAGSASRAGSEMRKTFTRESRQQTAALHAWCPCTTRMIESHPLLHCLPPHLT